MRYPRNTNVLISVLGWVPGIITMLGAGVLFYITSLTMWRYIMKNPAIHDICDFGYYIFGKSKVAYWFTAFMLLANNIMLIGFHVFTGAKVLNTLSGHSLCTVSFSVITTVMGIVLSTPRTLKHVSYMSMFSAFCMGLSVLLFMIFAGIEDAPLYGYNGDYPTDGPVRTYAFPLPGTTFVAGMNAALNITFIWVPQILFPTFISEMEKPQDFPKALAVLAVISGFLFIVPPAVGFRYLGQYATAPAFGSLGVTSYKKGSFAFVIVPTVIIGVIYSNVTSKFIFSTIMGKSRHAHSNTVIGWGVWVAVTIFCWVVGFIFAETIPSMGDFLSLLGAAFDSFFGCKSCPASLPQNCLLTTPSHLLRSSLLRDEPTRSVLWRQRDHYDHYSHLRDDRRSVPAWPGTVRGLRGYHYRLRRCDFAGFQLCGCLHLRDEIAVYVVNEIPF